MILTKEEKAWVKKVNKVLAECPSKRLRFFTTGDRRISIANNDTADEWDVGDVDTLVAAERHGSVADEQIIFTIPVEGVCG